MAASEGFDVTPREVPKVESRFRLIKTALPAPGTKEILEDLNRYESRSMHGQLPIIWDKAKDFSVYDHAGNKWIDLTSTIFVTNIGHANERLVSALQEQLAKPLVSTYAYANAIRARYLKKLIEMTPPQFEKAFLLSAGTEATEAVLKLMRMHGQKTGKRKPGVICIQNNWHGRTMGAQLMSSNVAQKAWIGHDDPHTHHIPFPYPWTIKNTSPEEFLEQGLKNLEEKGIDITQDVCGFMLETFQGWGAVFYPKEFVQAIERICRKHGILLAFDEMQAGFARTGKLFGYEHYGVQADLLACGKGMGGGLPLSGVLGRASVMDLPDVGNMSSTHSANPLVCAAGLAVLEEIESRQLVSETARKGELFLKRLNKIKDTFPHRLSHILGHGLLAAMLFHKPGSEEPDAAFTTKVALRCLQKGVLVVHTGRESIKLAPPLTITDDALNEALDVIEEAIREVDQEEN